MASAHPHPVRSAHAAGLRYVSDNAPGIARRRTAGGFRYLNGGGRAVRDAATLARIRRLAIPPAWERVWICPREDGHLQATGRDARGRKQYRYHAQWREIRDETKYGRMAAFGRALPRIRRRVRKDLALAGLPREKILATVVRLLETTFIRVGNEEYARENSSFGLTTLRNRQVQVDGAKIRFQFRGKSGVEHAIELHDRRMAGIVRRVRDLPGQELFQYLDENGERRAIESADVNAYIREAAGDEFTSKDFRTWAGTLLAARALGTAGAFESRAHAMRNVNAAIESVARLLGNTKAVCRKCYVHPAVVDAYLEGRLQGAPRGDAAVTALLRRKPQSDALAPILKRSISISRRSRRRSSAPFSGAPRSRARTFAPPP
jgi:DNA topoisomerase-1